MAAAKTITPETGLLDDLWDVQTKLDYTHAMIGLIIEQKDYPTLPSHQQLALQALSVFSDDARNHRRTPACLEAGRYPLIRSYRAELHTRPVILPMA